MSLNEVMTLASIVQLEAASEDEMPKVASVFLNRLDDPDTYPMLQSDTTTNYIKNVIKTELTTQLLSSIIPSVMIPISARACRQDQYATLVWLQ